MSNTPAIDNLMSPAPAAPARDRVLTIAIGDRRADGSTVPDKGFRLAADLIADDVVRHGGTVYAVTFGDGIGSDGDNANRPERSAIVLAGNVRDLTRLRRDVSSRLQSWEMTSAAFAIDRSHEPVFDTPTGARP